MKKEYAEEVAARIIEQLEQGTAPWQKPWQPGELRLPYNPTTGKEYRGMNSLWLHMQGHSDPRWMTYNQAAAEGAQVRKGSKGTHIVYWKFSEERKATDEQGRPVIDPDTGKQKTVTVQLERPRSFMAVVFNGSQIDGLPPLEARPTGPEPERHARAEAILANSGAVIRHEPGDRAFYRPSTDSITLPERNQFPTADNYYATALHELGHWTGHPSRLDRDLAHPFGSEGYAREELRAEIASLMLGERLEIGHDPGQHAAYVGSWVKALKEDPKEIFRAASDAERISAYVMDFEQEQMQTQTVERQPVPEIAPEVAAELQRDHENAVEGYSPLESWQMMKAEAERNGYSARIGFASGELGDFYEITYHDQHGEPSGIRTEMYGDSKLMTEYNGTRLSQFISNDDESQPATLRAAIQQHEAAKQARQAEQQSAPYTPGQEPPAYTVQSRRTVPENAANHAGQNAVYVQLDDGRKAWGFGATDEAAEQSAVERAQRVGLDADRAPTRAVLHEQPEKPMQSRTYLAVPYAEKNEAKALGAKWDKEAKSWYAPEGVDVATSGLARWSVDKANVVTVSEPKPAIEQFKDALKDAGLQLKGEVITDGKMQRVPVEGDRGGATSGAYAYHEAGRTPGGFIQNYKTGEVVHWRPEGKTPELSAADRARQAAEAAEQRKARDAARLSEHGTTAAAAQALWNEAPAATADNAYCKAKGIANPIGLRVVPDSVSPETAAHGIKIAKTAKEAKALREADPANRVFKAGDLLIPGTDGEGKLWTLQSVNPYFKSFMKGGRKAGLYTVAGADDPRKALAQDGDSPLVLAEGYATADTVSRLLGGKPVIVAFDSGNLDAVATELRERHPSRPLLIAADNDHNAPKELDANGKPKVNVGLVKATETAEKHGGGVMAPQFNDGEKGSDWNDLAGSRGDEAARRMLAEQMAVAKRDAAITAERLTTLARTRDMEARNDPTTSADDAAVATERGHAAEVLAGAQSALSEVRSMAADGVTGNTKGATRSAAAVKAGIDRKTEAMHDRAKEEREEVLNHGQTGPLDGVNAGVSWKKLPEQAKQALSEDVKNGKDVTLPKDAPAKLKQMAGLEPTPAPRSRSRGIDAGL
ncbi:zincin-like metallopeptidase domain-containing protein [Escherichia coli]|uniref:zincin-like metallopeptidase domain-containing protein n=1 Tax=Escherichia coli TaxID=562 RepID=UPI001EE9F103|nr:zincin-like metallopeptidase domain-containing protein [Escherichia coli]MCF3262337.1 ssDNA-binding domain-containing protein [Escherichia coli]